MTLTGNICLHCGLRWPQSPTGRFCTAECADAWYDAHPETKIRDGWMTRQDAVDRLLAKRGLMPRHRAAPRRGDN